MLFGRVLPCSTCSTVVTDVGCSYAGDHWQVVWNFLPSRIGTSSIPSASPQAARIRAAVWPSFPFTCTVPTKRLGTPPFFQCVLMALRVLGKRQYLFYG